MGNMDILEGFQPLYSLQDCHIQYILRRIQIFGLEKQFKSKLTKPTLNAGERGEKETQEGTQTDLIAPI